MTAPETAVLADREARARIRTELDATLFVEAGAGTGKTTELVARVVQLIASGRVPDLGGLAAITFTEAAAAELRDRLRREVGRAGERLDFNETERRRCRDSLAHLDEASVTTLHGFALRLLTDHPLEAGLPPGFEVADEVESSVAFNERWSGFVADLFDDVDLEPRLTRGLLLGLKTSRLRDIAQDLHDNWDRLGPATTAVPEPSGLDVAQVTDPLQAALDLAGSHDPGDSLVGYLRSDVGSFLDALAAATDDIDTVMVLAGAPSLRAGNRGARSEWQEEKADVMDLLTRGREARQALVDQIRRDCLVPVLERMAAFTQRGADERRQSGRLEFHDLLVLARNLLRDAPAVRRAVSDRFAHLLVDEFQDTDPLQLEIAALLAAADPDAEPGPWYETAVAPGKLFLVGDPKQSIYRFRRADIELYQRARDAFGVEVVRLTENFRSVPPILDWVNATFGELLGGPDDHQPRHVELVAHRPPTAADSRVLTVGGPREARSVAEVREQEAAELAALIETMQSEQWPVVPAEGEARPIRYDDIAVLVPTRTPLSQIERALNARRIPYRLESRSLVYATDEVRDLLVVLEAVDDPGDDVAVVASLRSPGFACSDADLARFRLAGGTWDYRGPPPPDLDPAHPVVEGLSALRELHRVRSWLPVSELVEHVIRDRRLVELTAARGRPRDHWRRLRFIADQARAYVEAGGSSLAEFVDWARSQADERAQRLETVVAEADDRAVRILTVHGAKGLEFPAVILAGLNTEWESAEPVVLWAADGPEAKIGARGAQFATPGYHELLDTEKRLDRYESLRLLYVAATRARDHLVVSLFHKAGATKCHAHTLHELRPDGVAPPPFLGRHEQLELEVVPAGPAPAADERREWISARARLLDRANRPTTVTPSSLADEVDPVAPGERVGRRGRAGTARGRAVHAALQLAQLDGSDVAQISRAQAAIEAVSAEEVEALTRSALESAPVVEARNARYWRETFVAAEVADTLVEGFVDLLYERGDGALVVVDYKTDREGPATADRYRLQAAAYAAAVEAATGRPVVDALLVFAAAESATVVAVEDLAGAIREVSGLVGSTAPGS